MKYFEIYRPIMIGDYTLDWLNNFTVKEINALRMNKAVAKSAGRETDFDLYATVGFIQNAMKQVMSNQSLIYGIKKRSTGELVGEFGLLNYDADENCMELHYELLPEFQHQGIMSAILDHMVTFAFEELGLDYLHAVTNTPHSVAQHQLEKLGFKPTIQTTETIHFRLYAE